jgi:hypothetical protein
VGKKVKNNRQESVKRGNAGQTNSLIDPDARTAIVLRRPPDFVRRGLHVRGNGLAARQSRAQKETSSIKRRERLR